MWAVIGAALSWLWGGISAAIAATVQFLVWAYNLLLAMVIAAGNGLLALGRVVESGLKDVWDFAGWTYDNVLKPIGQKVWTFVDRVKTTLNNLFGPVIKFLRAVRDEILKIYTRFVRPVLDIIDATRIVLDGLKALHIQWAAALDNWLANLEQQINAPFQYVLSQINGLINFVNKIATADGLFQRLALLQSLQRDAAYWIGMFWGGTIGTLPATNTPGTALNPFPPYGPDYYGAQLGAYLAGDPSDFTDGADAAAALWAPAAGFAASSTLTA